MNETSQSLVRRTENQVTVLEPGGKGHFWRDFWAYRELFMVFAWRDISVRYKQSVLGIFWSLLRPLLTMIILTFVFGRVAGLDTIGDAPYALMVLSGSLPWFLFSTSLSESSQGLVSNANMIKKIYFPRIMTPLASCSVSAVDFLISLLLMGAMMIGYGYMPDWRIIALPAFIILALVTALGPGLMLAALNVRYRDFRFIVPFIVQFGLYVAPVGFASSVVPDQWRFWYSLNPLVTVIDGFRWSLLRGDVEFDPVAVSISVLIAFTFLWLGFRVFRGAEKTFADVI